MTAFKLFMFKEISVYEKRSESELDESLKNPGKYLIHEAGMSKKSCPNFGSSGRTENVLKKWMILD